MPKQVELSEEATTKEAVKAFNKYTSELNAYHEAKAKELKTEIKQDQQATAAQTKQEAILKFLKTAEHATNPEVHAKMVTFFNGGASIEDAHRDAVTLVVGKDEANKDTDTNKAAKKVTNISSSDSAEGEQKEVEEKKPTTTREAAKSNLDRILSEDPEAKKMFDEME